MARLAFGVAGAAVGSYFGPFGAQVGFAIGSGIGGALFPPDPIIQEGAMPNAQLTTASAYGLMRPISYATIPLVGNIIDGSDEYITKHESKQDAGGKGGFGGGQEVVNVRWTKSRDLAIGLGEPISAVLQIYANDQLIYDITPGSTVTSPQWLSMKVYLGDENQGPDPTLQVIHGADTLSYRGEAYVVFTRFELEEFGNQIPTFRFLVVANADPVQSWDQKVFSGSDLGALLQDRTTSLLYYVCGGQEGQRLGYVYDPATEQEVISLRWPDESDVTGLDNASTSALCSLPLIISGVQVSAGPNASLVVCMNNTSGNPVMAVYDTQTGAYQGAAPFGIDEDSNTSILPSDERSGIIYRAHQDSAGLYSYLSSWLLMNNSAAIEGPIVAIRRQDVIIPIPNRDGIREWEWSLNPSYPEGTNRNGRILVAAYDEISDDNYLCLVADDSIYVEGYVLVNQYVLRGGVKVIVWDSVQQYFWVIGENSTISNTTRIEAYDLDLSLQYSEVWDTQPGLPLQGGARGFTTYDPNTFSIWMFNQLSGNLLQWDTVNHEFLNNYAGFPIENRGTMPSMIYNHYTQSAWRRKADGKLDILRIGRVSDTGTPLDAVVANLCDRAKFDTGQYDVAELSPATVNGFGIITNGQVRNNVEILQQTYLFDGIDKGDFIDFKFRGQDVAGTIPQDDMGADGGTNIIEINRIMDLELPGQTEVTYYNREMEYEQNTQVKRRWSSLVKDNSQRLSLPIVMTDDEAMHLADISEHLSYIERMTFEVSVLPKWQHLTVGDVVELETDTATYKSRILLKSFEGGYVKFLASRENTSVLKSFMNGGEAPGRDVSITISPLTSSVHLDVPLLIESHNNAGYYLSVYGHGDGWAGGNIYKSADGNEFALSTTVLSESKVGTVDQAIGANAVEGLWDRSSVIRVYMRNGTLESRTEAEVLQGLNTAAIGINGRFEIVSYASAVLVETGVYDVSVFLRGRLGTGWAIGTHQFGDVFCVLSPDDLTYLLDTTANIGRNFLYRAVSFGGSLYGDRVTDQFHTNTGVSIKPLSPAHLKYSKNNATFDMLFEWRPRTRFLWKNYWSSLPSDPDNYSLDIALPDGSTKSIPITEAKSYLYTRAEQVADGFSTTEPEQSIATAAQVSLAYPTDNGKGYPETIPIIVGPPFPQNGYQQQCKDYGALIIWAMDDQDGAKGVTDVSGNFYVGQYNVVSQGGSFTYQQEDAFTQAYGYSVLVDDAARMDMDPTQDLATATISFSCLFKLTEIPSRNNEAIAGIYSKNGVNVYLRAESNTNLELYANDGSGSTVITLTATATLNVWYHAVVTIGPASGLKVYIDGVDSGGIPAFTSLFSGAPVDMALVCGFEEWESDHLIHERLIDTTCVWPSIELTQSQVTTLQGLV